MAARKKKTIRKASPSQASNEFAVDQVEMLSVDDSPRKSSLLTKRNIVILLLLVSFGYLVYLNRSLFVAAMVNNQPISRLAVISELEKRQGKSALDSIITETLIMQEAQKNNVVVSQDEVDTEVNKISESVKAQGQELDQLLTMQGMTKTDLEKQIRIQKMVEKLLDEKLAVSDEEVKKYLEDNKDTIDKEAKIEDLETQAKEQLRQEKLSTEFQTWLTDLKAKANVRHFVSY